MRVAVIGGGPSGLAALKYLTTAHKFFPIEPIEARLFESEATIGGTFKHRSYEDAELVSSRQLTTFSDFRCPLDDPDFLQASRYCAYLEDYFTKMSRSKFGGHVVNHSKNDSDITEQWTCDAVAICTGLHVTPNFAPITGIDNVPKAIHSSAFKERKQFGVDKNIIILGSGETGMDLAYLAVTSPTKTVTLCHRDGFLCAPKRVPDPVIFGGLGGKPSKHLNVPVDVSSASLFDTAYVHPLLNASPLLWNYYDRFIKYTLWLVSGTQHGLDQWVGGISKERYHASKIFLNKSNKAMPYISAPYRTHSLLNDIRSSILQVPILDTGDRQIDLAPWPEFIDEKGIVHFRENGGPEAAVMRNKVCKPDLLVFATGYKQEFPFLDETYVTPGEVNIRNIWKSGDESVGFIGFVRPSFGAIPPLAELQAELWILALLKRLPHSLQDEDNYRLRVSPNSRIQYGVDHESYAYQLAVDMGSAPSFTQVLAKGWKITLVWALGANFNTKFRLVGPWKWDGAKELLKTEMWETITRRGGFFGHITLSGLPILVFGSISASLWVYCEVLRLLNNLVNFITGDKKLE